MILIDSQYYLTSPSINLSAESDEIYFSGTSTFANDVNIDFMPSINIVSFESPSVDNSNNNPNFPIEAQPSIVELTALELDPFVSN